MDSFQSFKSFQRQKKLERWVFIIGLCYLAGTANVILELRFFLILLVLTVFTTDRSASMSDTFYVGIHCSNCNKTEYVQMSGVTRDMAEMYCGLIDGTSPMYKFPPTQESSTQIGKCQICKKMFRASLVEEKDLPTDWLASLRSTIGS